MIKKYFFVAILSVMFGGCSSYVPTTEKILTYHSTVSPKEINSVLFTKFPFSKNTSAGSLVYKNAFLTPIDNGKSSISVSFSLKSYEIPEGTDGTVLLSADMRYDAKSKQVFLTNIKTKKVDIADTSLSKYVSSGSRSTIAAKAISKLSSIAIYKVPKSFTSRFIKSVTVEKGKIVVAYGL